MDKPKTLWVVSGGAEAVPGILKAKALGHFVIVSDGSSDCPGAAVADAFFQASTYDIDASVGAARSYHQKVRPLDGVICLAADVPLTVASIAAALDLPGIPVDAARMAMDKMAMKDRFAAEGIPIPWYCEVFSAAELFDVVDRKGFPLVIKPVDSRGARGVLRLIQGVDLDWAFQHAQSYSPSGRVMVEEYLYGQQVSTESVLLDGAAYTPGFADRNYEYLERFSPYIIENGGQQPSCLDDNAKEQIRRCAEQAGRALGISTGIAKGDMVWTESGPKVIEIAARLSGGWFSSDQIPLATGVDIVAAAIRIALGEKIDETELVPKYQRGVAIRYFFPPPGQMIAVRNTDAVKRMPGVEKLNLFVRPGEEIESVTNHTKRAGCVIASGDTCEEAVVRASAVVDKLVIETRPV